MTGEDLAYAVVVPTIGRPSLDRLLERLSASAGAGPPPRRVIVVDDRPLTDCHPLPVRIPAPLADRLEIVAGCGNGPAAARNTGWRATAEPWVVFLDDDTLPGPAWTRELAADLSRATTRTAGVQAVIDVPLPPDRRPTDWERCTAGLAGARWITADMAYRRTALADVGGFDERFRRAYREDTDLALRMLEAGWALAVGRRRTVHPVRPTDRWVSVRNQAGNADDALMTRLHGPGWWRRADAPRGRLPQHLVVTAAALAALGFAGARRPAPAALGAGVWLAGTAQFALARIVPGPRTRREVADMALTSIVIPPAACGHWLRGLLRHPRPRPWSGAPEPIASTSREALARSAAPRRQASG